MSEIHPRLGALKDKADPRDFSLRSIMRYEINLPPIVDYESRYPKVEDQGYRGACVSFASAAVKEYQEVMERKFRKPFDLSEEWIYEQIRQPGGGAYPRDAFKVIVTKGVPREQYYPYNPESYNTRNTLDDSPRNFKPSRKAMQNAKYYMPQGYARMGSVESMRQTLLQNGPFMIGVDWLNGWFRDWQKLDNGYPVLGVHEGNMAGGHAIAVVGYDDNKEVFKFRNSWSKDWARFGYAYITYQAVEQNLSDAWAIFDTARNKNIKHDVVGRLMAAAGKEA